MMTATAFGTIEAAETPAAAAIEQIHARGNPFEAAVAGVHAASTAAPMQLFSRQAPQPPAISARSRPAVSS